MKIEKMTLEEATEYLESVGEWTTVRNVPRDVMILWAEYLKQKENYEILDNRGCPSEVKKGGQHNKKQQVRQAGALS